MQTVSRQTLCTQKNYDEFKFKIALVVTALLDRDQYVVQENARDAEVCISVVGLLKRQLILMLSTLDGSATGTGVV